MTLRDYFAAQVLPTLRIDVGCIRSIEETAAECARIAYMIADAMLAERAKP